MGYAPVWREEEAGPGGEPIGVDFILRPSRLSLPAIQVTGTPAARDALFASQPTTQLRGRALERNLSSSVAETLAEQPEMAVRYAGYGAAVPVVRGLTGDRILLLQDGQRVGDLAATADDHTVTIDPLAAKRIEVVRGPATLMYGNNALDDVVNVITGADALRVPERPEWQGAFCRAWGRRDAGGNPPDQWGAGRDAVGNGTRDGRCAHRQRPGIGKVGWRTLGSAMPSCF